MIRIPLSRFSIKQLAILMLSVCLLCNETSAQDSSKKNRLVPDHMKLQFAGNIGFFSVAGGYANKKQNLAGDLYYGYLPASVGGLEIHTLTTKLTWFPIKSFPVRSINIKPLSTGLIVNYTFGEQYFSVNPAHYPYNYYDHSTGLHFGAFIGGEAGYRFKKGNGLGLYYELVTLDKEIISYLANMKTLSPRDIVSLGIGIRYSFK